MDNILKFPFVKTQVLYSISNRMTIACGLTAGFLAERAIVPYWNSSKKNGYQRPANQKRVNDLKKGILTRKIDIPTAILANIRDFKDEHISYSDGDDRYGMLTLGSEKLYIVDGQHRFLAVKELLGSEGGGRFRDYIIPCILILGASELEEMKEFYIVNTTAKSVKTDLALAILQKRAENEEIKYDLIESGDEWKVVGAHVTELVEKKSNVWNNKIATPEQTISRTRVGGPVISLSGFVYSLKTYLSYPYIKVLSTERQADILVAYWRGISEVLPSAFIDPSSYSIQKTVGVSALHEILPAVIEIIRTSGDSEIDHESYSNIMEDVLSGISGSNIKNEVLSKEDFWLSGESGAVGAYSSSAGKKVLVAKLNEQVSEVLEKRNN